MNQQMILKKQEKKQILENEMCRSWDSKLFAMSVSLTSKTAVHARRWSTFVGHCHWITVTRYFPIHFIFHSVSVSRRLSPSFVSIPVEYFGNFPPFASHPSTRKASQLQRPCFCSSFRESVHESPDDASVSRTTHAGRRLINDTRRRFRSKHATAS